jgi:hypothetical protein
MKSNLYLTLIGSAAIALSSASFASAACIDDLRTLHGQMATGSVGAADPATTVPQTSTNPNEVESSSSASSGGTTATEEINTEDALAATGNATFDTAVQEAMTASASGDEAACNAALERARAAM